MGTGPAAAGGYDLQAVEIAISGNHYFLIGAGSERGSELLGRIPSRPATIDEINAGEDLHRRATSTMGRTLDTRNLKEVLAGVAADHQWEVVGQKCLACANCTLVCPTCFCSTVEDVIDLSGAVAERKRRWDSCFTAEFSYIHGGSVRATVHSRYRQWLMHKLSSWVDQFGTYGCVGCGRCITWCPVGIDITEEAAILRKRAEQQQSVSA